MKILVRSTARFFATIILGITVLCGYAGCKTEINDNYSEAVVSEVIDGDTIKLTDGRLIRYIGIDTPELRIKDGSNKWHYKPEPFGEQAARLNRKLVAGKKIRLIFDKEKKDKYKRTLAYVYADDIFVNARIIEEGLAEVLIIRPNTAHAEEFLRLLEKAKKEKKGMWQDS